MFYFDKKIYYIDYYENGNRISNAGFISLTFKDDECLVHIGIRNLPGMDSRVCRWFGLVNSEQVFLEEFRIEKGKADFVNCYRSDRMGKTEVDFSALDGFYFALGKKRWGSCFFNKIMQNAEPDFEHISDSPAIVTAAGKKENTEKEVETEEDRKPEDTENVENTVGQGAVWEEEKEEKNDTAPAHRTTWEELTKTHQLVHPFDDQGDYISINPFTLKTLAPEYRKLANNSFLLHGFYNYRHIILGYYQDEKRQGYYVGVPGNFDEREQMVAEMFGFEGYEPAGGVGYYMRRVEF